MKNIKIAVIFLLLTTASTSLFGIKNPPVDLTAAYNRAKNNGNLLEFHRNSSQQRSSLMEYLEQRRQFKHFTSSPKDQTVSKEESLLLKEKTPQLNKKNNTQYSYPKMISNVNVGFELSLEGDFDKDFIINASLIGSCDTGPLSWKARIDLNNDNITPQIKAYPALKTHKNISPASAILYATATNIALSSLAVVYQKELERRRTNKYEDYYMERCIEEIKKGDILFKQAEKDLYHV